MNEDYRKYPKLREDIKISKMVNKTSTNYVLKDPMKNTYFRFGESEWEIIKLFDGSRTLEKIVEDFNKTNDFTEIDLSVAEDYWNDLDGMHLLVKSTDDMNVMMVEKVREMREFQLLSKKGSIMYKRFPIVDPDKFFDKIIPKLKFFWTKTFFIFSITCMLISSAIILANWTKFNTGLYELFNFSEMSFSHLAILWVVIYITVAIHELGHGLTCKFYGGEVHELGFLLLFFQPCLYANVNDAWLFDKKWKQILVTVAGGYIEYFIGSMATFIWVLSNPNTFINVLAFQVMTIASLSTIMFNFNPLIKLDGYYLLSDILEAPNLKEESGKYVKYLVSKYIFRMPEENNRATKREKMIYFVYGIASVIWMTLLLTGLVMMAKGILVEKFHGVGMLITFWIAYKIFGGHLTKGSKFMVKWFIQYRQTLMQPKNKKFFAAGLVALILFFFIPVHYKIKGECSITPSKMLVLRPVVDAEVSEFYKQDGDIVKKDEEILKLKNMSVKYDRKMASLSLVKSQIKLRKTIISNPEKIVEIQNEVDSKSMELKKKELEEQKLSIKYEGQLDGSGILSCQDQERIVGSFYKKGDEICRIYDLRKVKTLIEVNEQNVAYLNEGQEVDFKLISNPLKTFTGNIHSIRPTGKGDPKNPTRKVYTAEIELINDGSLRAGMKGIAKIYGNKVSVAKYIFVKLSSALRMDLFF